MTLVVNALPTLGYSCPQLKTLDLHRCNRLDIDQVRSLVDTRLRDDGMTGLVKLGIYGGIGDALPEWDATGTWLKERVKFVTLLRDADLV
ncbi:hypothetical protein M407DRAFT_242071 [Tulasnella calospora MUT 4182]|uniref:F-box domain-containing protein n=1 Tax=Tulasnella calospora MUT 4182 TaxID=1051891 RepID=A0A0C3MAZ5_9AGAM|nr:hypothetical protein M407DRAFT_242071 [Tulasnella calospora MUT 4182]